MNRSLKFSPEVQERAVRLVEEARGQLESKVAQAGSRKGLLPQVGLLAGLPSLAFGHPQTCECGARRVSILWPWLDQRQNGPEIYCRRLEPAGQIRSPHARGRKR
jgi:hypothetical protein